MKHIIVCCGNAMASSSMIETCLQDLFEKNQINVTIHKCRVEEVDSLARTIDIDLVIPNGTIKCENAPVVSGFPYLTGIGIEKMEKEILDIIKS